MKWEVLSSEYLTKHPPYFVTRKDVCRKPDGTLIPAYYVVELPPSVLVVGMVENDKVLMVEQYRHPVKEISLEFPGGFVDQGETAEQAARREMLEETGYLFEKYEYLGKVAANPGVLNNFTHLYLATNVVGKKNQQLEPSEQINIKLVSRRELLDLLDSNQIIQALHATGCFYALMHLGIFRVSL